MIKDKLKEVRERTGMNKKEFAEYIGIKYTTYNNYETGAREPDSEFLIMFSKKFNVSTDFILGLQEDKEILYSYELKASEFEHIEKYRSLDPHGQQTVDYILDRELARSGQLRQSQSENEALKLQLSHERTVSRFFAYYGRVAAAGTSVEFSDIAAGVRAYRENEINKQADYVIGVNGDSMEPEYFDGDIVYVQKTDHIEIGDIGIFQRGNSIYIKKVGENGLISLNPDYPPLMADGDRIMVLGKVLGKAEEI